MKILLDEEEWMAWTLLVRGSEEKVSLEELKDMFFKNRGIETVLDIPVEIRPVEKEDGMITIRLSVPALYKWSDDK